MNGGSRCRPTRLDRSFVPAANRRQDDHADERNQSEPRNTALSAGQDEETRQVAEPAPARHYRRPGTEIARSRGRRRRPAGRGGTIPDGRLNSRFRATLRRRAARGKFGAKASVTRAQQRAAHAKRQRVRLRPTVGEEADERLQQGSCNVEHQCQKADLARNSNESCSSRADRSPAGGPASHRSENGRT